LHDVVNFYNRGGDRRGAPNADTSGYPLSNQAIGVLLNGADVPANLVEPPNSFGQTNPTNLDANIGNDSGGEGGVNGDVANGGLIGGTLVGIPSGRNGGSGGGGSGRGGGGGGGGNSGGNGGNQNIGNVGNTVTLTQNSGGGGGGGGGGGKGLGLSQQDVDDVVNFLLSLTDNRVACHSDVFDHPELVVFLGQNPVPAAPGSLKSADIKVLLPAVGRRGLATCFPNTGELFGELQNAFMSIVTPVP
jgi:hypothetical protein